MVRSAAPALLAGALLSIHAPAARAQVSDPKPATPPPTWITYRDYPVSAMKGRHQGVTAFTLEVGPDGRVRKCTVTLSTGWPDLDAATCPLLRKRARFVPARDAAGNKVAGSWSTRFAWSLPGR